MLVREESIRHAVYLLWKNEKQVVEGSGVAGVAMLLENSDSFTEQTVAIVVTGGNIDDSLLEEHNSFRRIIAVSLVCSRFSAGTAAAP